jgi:hypothetical protein
MTPLLLLIISSSLIAYQLLSKKKLQSSQRNATSQTRQVTLMMIVVVFVFITCMGPLCILDTLVMLDVFRDILSKHKALMCASFVRYIHSMINPLIYNFMAESFRNKFDALFARIFSCTLNFKPTPIALELLIDKKNAKTDGN